MPSPARLVRFGVVALTLCAPVACVSNERPEPPGVAVVWDFPLSAPSAPLSLWPPTDSRARRSRHDLKLEEAEALTAFVTEKDPWITWQLGEAIKVPAVRLDVDTDAAGRFQVFWTSLECPVFAEQCSTSQEVSPGRSVVNLLVRTTETVREVRVDLPEKAGATVRFFSVAILSSPEIDTPWAKGSSPMRLESAAYGLHVLADAGDPWIHTPTPGLVATRVSAVEMTLRGPANPPQLYWTGPCPDFVEECSIRLAPVDAGELTHRAAFDKLTKWTGDIKELRLDPGPSAGEYFLERIALIHE